MRRLQSRHHRSACAGRVPQALPACADGGNRAAAGRSVDRFRGDRRAAVRSRRACDRGDAARQGRDGGQTRHHHARAACGRGTRGRRDRAHLVDLPGSSRVARGAGGVADRTFRRDRPAGAHLSAVAASPEPRAAAVVVLRSTGLWRDHQRHRRARDRSVSCLRQCVRRRDRAEQYRCVRHRARRLRGFCRAGSGNAVGPRLRAARLVHAGRIAHLGRWPVLRRRHRRHAGTSEEPRHRGP